MIWTIISALACIALVIRLTLYTDSHRECSRWIYRVLLYCVTLYGAHVVIDIFYYPEAYTNPFLAIFHVSLLITALVMRPEYLPWNIKHDTSPNQTSSLDGSFPRRPR